jgi:hypothetical protein
MQRCRAQKIIDCVNQTLCNCCTSLICSRCLLPAAHVAGRSWQAAVAELEDAMFAPSQLEGWQHGRLHEQWTSRAAAVGAQVAS